MFWKIVRWGGTGLMVVVVLAALVLAEETPSNDTPSTAAVAPATNSKFNF